MKIENQNVNTVKLESIEQGKCFKAEDNGIYMATDDEYQDMRLYGRYDKGKVTFGDWKTHEIWRTDPDKYYELLNKAMTEKTINDWLKDCKSAINEAIEEAEAEHRSR